MANESVDSVTVEEVTAEVSAWVAENWSTDLTVGEWWQLLTDARLSNPALPENAYGRGYGRAKTQAVRAVLRDADCLGPPTGLGMMLAAPTIAAHGSPEQIDEYIPKILNGTHGWCQLFSEPNAGSDLAGLQCKAIKDGDEWIVNGQKVWTSGGQVADMGMLIARTDPDLPKHQGITYFAISMLQDGMDVRPLKEMSGRALFNEVFLTDCRVPDDAMIGGISNGWRVTNTTLMVERTHLGSSQIPLPTAGAGSIPNALGRKVTDFVGKIKTSEGGVPGLGPALFQRYVELARKEGKENDPVLRQQMMKLHTLVEINRMTALRAKSGGMGASYGNIAKLMMSDMFRGFRELGCAILGADAMLDAKDSLYDGAVQEVTVFSPGPSIYGGTDQVQRNIIGERVLGLPKEPGPDKNTPFSELTKN